ncbi:disease resistance protein RPV1-like [Eucalyptus grandis]|uniref:disease resistance protein RPV1-like n=1 Tax=Eucalyptus grandis TaxID=71139 RepID=UPI00192EC3C6|nr:disease resistance protein RPV1-like [Eucalyptus grandis]
MSSSFRPKKKQKISSSFSSSSSEAKWPFDVFLSFRGEDVRHGFVDDLHKCLLHRGINAYIDGEDLRPANQISPALTKAIEESRIAVLVFSKNYASSRWCLDELVKVMECKRLKGQLVLPVFYGVEPREVRGQRESFGKALARHEEKLGKDSERVVKWRQALIEAANLSGWHYDHGDGTKFTESIVKEISNIAARAPLSVAKYPVGVGCRVEKVMSLLNMGSDDTRIIGIWGTGGVGKTTIANDVYNIIYSQFDGCCFLANVRETSGRPDGLVHLQEKLLREVLWKESITVLNVYGGANLIRDRLCCRKILLVLDDVDHENQLNALAGECAWFGKGSRIIITTRDKQVLTSCPKDWVYEVEPLDPGEAFKLLSAFAFSGNQTKDISTYPIHDILDYANGLPLAIVVLGGLLCGRSRGEWERKLEQLAESPLKDINKVLKISFDALDDNQKDIFLDIACFFKGKEMDYVTRVLNSCDFDTLIGIRILIERSLVTIEYDSIVQMHDLIQLMGQDVVKNEWLDDPGKRSRLWCYDDVFEVLSEDTVRASYEPIDNLIFFNLHVIT